MKATFRICHKYLALCLGAVWLLQALSGMVLVFHRDLDDRSLGALARPVNLAVVDQTLAKITHSSDATVIEYFVSGGVAGQIDVLVQRRGAGREVVRVDGATGDVLRTSAWEEPRAELGVFRFVLLLHKQLLAGKFGEWLIGLSGAFLIVSIALGLKLAWPKAGQWRGALLPRAEKTPVANAFGWHRAMGLCLAPFALVVALTGSLMTWTHELPGASATPVASPANSAVSARDGRMISPSEAVAAAQRIYPAASIAVVSMPAAQRDWYSIRLRQPGELRRIYGTTLVRVDAGTGAPLSTVDALQMSLSDRMLVALYPIHSGEWGGVVTRLLALIVGLWLVGTMTFGLLLWSARRATRSDKAMGRYGARSV